MRPSLDSPPSRPSRREFIFSTARDVAIGALAPAAMARLAHAAGAPTWRMRCSTSSIHFQQLAVERACERIAALGFEAVDIWSAHAGCPHLDDVLVRLGPNGLHDLLERLHLKLFAFSVYQGGYPRYAELLGKAGGGVAIRGSEAPASPGELAARMRAFLESLKGEIELAEKNNSFLAIENHGDALLDSLDSLRAFVELNRSARLGIALAPYHLQSIGASVAEAIEICGRQLLFFYAWQKGEDLAQLPGHGPVDFGPWLASLAKIGYQGYVNPFMHGRRDEDAMSAALSKSLHYLQEAHARQESS